MNTSEGEGVKTKVCSKCKLEKYVEEFSQSKKERDGLCFNCKGCNTEYRKANSDKIREYEKEYRKANSDKIREHKKEYRKAKSDKIIEYAKEYRKANSDKIKEYRKVNSDKIKEYRKVNSDKIREYEKEYRKANSDKRNANAAKRRSNKLQATPPWLTSEQLSAIEGFYTEAKDLEKATGIKHHVDHIVPLQGKNVCGLHVPWNLNVLTATENIVKNNHHPNEWEDT